MKRRRLTRIGVATAVFVVICGVGQAPAAASPDTPSAASDSTLGPTPAGLPKGFDSWQQLFDAQQPLDEWATRLEEAAQASQGSGFTSVRVDAELNLLTLYWRGEPSVAEQKVINAVRADGIDVKLVPARYSRSELDSMVDLVGLDARKRAGDRVSYITKQPDGSGLTVGVQPDPAGAFSFDSSTLGRELPHLQAAIAKGGITVRAAPKQKNPLALREDDGVPHAGGALVRNTVSRGRCTSGFAVNWPSVGDYMTTAAHCGWVGVNFANGADVHMGVMTNGNTGYDMRFIRTVGSPGSYGAIYTGSPARVAGQTGANITGASHTHIGDWLCVSGAFRGLRCSIRASGPTVDCRDHVATHGLGNANGCWYVEGGISSVNELFFGHGDSGGPVYVPLNGINRPDSRGNARGLISSLPVGWNWQSCPNPVDGGTGQCATAVWFTDIVSAIAPWAATGMRVKTN